MQDTVEPAQPDPAPPVAGTPSPKRSEWVETVLFFIKLVVIVAIIRSFVFSPFNIPSGSMLPRLLIGDYLFVTKWNYGYSRYSLPFNLPLIPGRIFASTPERGDVVVFKAPPADDADWIKRVIGLPGDTVQMKGGQLILNGKPVPKQRIADFIVPVSPNSGCPNPEFQDVDSAGAAVCRYPRYLETLPSGKSYQVLDQGFVPADDTEVYHVPAGHVFLMGDNRDDSEDSRFQSGIGYVPMQNLEGKAVLTFFSTNGAASLVKPWTWPAAVRWDRIGEGF